MFIFCVYQGESLQDPKVNDPQCNPSCINRSGCGVCHLENSISFFMFLLGFYLNYLGKVRQSVFEIRNCSVISDFIAPFQPWKNSSTAIVYFSRSATFFHTFYTREYDHHIEP